MIVRSRVQTLEASTTKPHAGTKLEEVLCCTRISDGTECKFQKKTNGLSWHQKSLIAFVYLKVI